MCSGEGSLFMTKQLRLQQGIVQGYTGPAFPFRFHLAVETPPIGIRRLGCREVTGADGLEERHRRIRHRRVVLIRNASVVSKHLPLFGLNQAKQAVDR
jgi:hypothetical protein